MRPRTARATLIGNAEAVPENDVAGIRERYLTRHENKFTGWTFPISASSGSSPSISTMSVASGVMGWVETRDYEHTASDPLAEAAHILAHMNADHVDAMILLARLHAGIEASEATMTSVDRLGFTLSG